MSAPKLVISALAMTLASVAAHAVDNYVFDSVINIDFKPSRPVITGILRSTSTPVTVTYPSTVAGTVALCMPVMLTMMEKPGRYYLHVTYDPTPGVQENFTCGLELRS